MGQKILLHFFLLAFLLIFSNCSNSSSIKQITLANGISFKLFNGETNTDIDQYIINYYESYFNTDIENQIPLYKYIKHNKYEILSGFLLAVIPQVQFNKKVKNIKILIN